MKRTLPLAVLVVIFTCGPVSAQNAREIGFDFRVTDQDSIGVTWHLTNRFAFRPLLTYDSLEVEVFNPFFGPIRERARVYGTDLGFLFTVHSHENLNLYTGAALQYSYTNVDQGSDIHSKGAEALFGMRFMFAKRLGIFSEVGARYPKDRSGNDLTTYGLFTGGLGLTIYVN